MPGEEEPTETTAPTRTVTATDDGAPPAPPLQLAPGEWVAGRYRVEALLGRGGYGEVYRVADAQEDGRAIALKLHRLRALSRGALDSLRMEFALLASLAHPNLATVHDFAYVEGEYAFFTQSLVEGVPLHRAGVEPVAPRGVRLLAQLCRALDYLHARGIVHGDVKPGNVLVEADDRVVLLDFGVSRALGGSTGAKVVGSPPYMAPELITGGVADGRTDLYALGITLYQLVAGGVPFRGTSTQIMMAHVEEELPELPGSVALPLQALIARLTAKDPDQRPATASEVLSELSRIAHVPVAADTSETLASHVLSARFVGREPELTRLTARAARPTLERPPLLVEGEAGTGKSRLLREARTRVQLRGQQWIQVQAPRGEGGQPLLAWIARAILGPAQIAALDDEERLELARALPELRRPRERLAVPLDPARARRRRLDILGARLAARFAWKPGVLAVEDLHWVPPAQQRELVAVTDRARREGARCLLVLATRPDGLATDVREALAPEPLPCDELPAAASRALVEATFGDAGVLDGTELGARLAEGPSSALWVQESLRLALERGVIRRAHGRFARRGEVAGRPLSEVLAARVEMLSRDARTLALAGAVLAVPAGSSELARVAGLARHRASSALAELVRRGIVERRTDGRNRTSYAMHDRYGDAVLAAMPARRIRAARRRAGKHLARVHRKDFRGLSRAAHELESAGDRARARRVLERATELAVQAGRPEHAVALLEREMALLDDDRPRAARAMRLFDLAVLAGHREAAGGALMELAQIGARLGDPAIELAVALRGAQQALRDGDVEEAHAACAAALARAEAAGLDELRCELAIAAGRIALARGSIPDSLACYEDGAARARALGRPALEAPASLGVALVHVRLGADAEAQAAAERAVRAAKAAKDPVVRSGALRMLGNAHFVGGRRARALRSYRKAVQVARRSGGTESEAKALNNVATCAHALGQVGEALAAWRRSIALKERVGAIASAQLTWASMSGVLTIMGARDEARRAQQHVIDAGRADAHTATALAWSNRGDLEVFEGRLDAALAAYERGEAGYRAIGMHQLRAHALTGAVRASAMRDAPGDRARTPRWLDDLEAVVAQSSTPEDQRRLLTARAIARDLAGDPRAALASARRAARLTRSDTVYEDAFGSAVDARWMVAVLLRRMGRHVDAERAAARARALLDRRVRALDDAEHQARLVEAHPLHRAVRAGALAQPPGRTWSFDGR
ncbi:MAG TPA: protein kinase [Sandaracinaceae bacterium LLY-WYZ-13_1]|nr:protein kinase [Sandaracinaceae bacterium LLY-WYZ-13_1]